MQKEIKIDYTQQSFFKNVSIVGNKGEPTFNLAVDMGWWSPHEEVSLEIFDPFFFQKYKGM